MPTPHTTHPRGVRAIKTTDCSSRGALAKGGRQGQLRPFSGTVGQAVFARPQSDNASAICGPPASLNGVGSTNRSSTLRVVLATSLLPPFAPRAPHQAMEPTEKTAPPGSVAMKMISERTSSQTEPPWLESAVVKSSIAPW